MIEDWRSYWNEEFPFLFVQLANFKAIQNEPREDDWAELREAQLMTLALPNTGMAVTIDIGDADDIHPRNKQEVGRRLGLNALKQVYGKDVVHSGPAYRSMRIEKDALRLFFDHTYGGLFAKNGEQLVGFAIAGKDRKFVWADAVIEGASVLAKSPLVKDPEAVRYAWASNPVCNLYNKAGLPASPFRTDTWPGITQPKEIDICIYGGTSSGIIAGVAAARMGKKTIVIEQGKYIGGLTTGGLGQTDIGNKCAITGLSRDFYRRIGNEYGYFEGWTFSPSVALKVYQDMIQEVNLQVIREFELSSVEKEGSRIRSVTVENKGTGARMVVRAKQFIDATYEGDLMARSGVSYSVGRESNAQYGEEYNGVQLREYHQFPDGIDPYRIKGNPASGLLWGIQEGDLSLTGSGDHKVQAYNFRLCLTQDKSNQLPFYPPDEYHPEHYELLIRIMEVKPWNSIHDGMIIKMMPGGKTDINNRGPISTDFIGGSWDYPEASYKKRKEIWKAHEDYIKGLLYFLSHDERVPVKIREEMSGWGYACDEFTDNGGFPSQLYVREARRMIGEYVMTEHNCVGDSVVKDGIGMAAYTMDSHNCQRIVVNGMVKNEGDVQIGGFPPYPVSFRSITPRKEECTNLLVPVCLSASHIAFGSIRMEPVFMVLGQSAAVAACLAIDEIKPVQEADIVHIQESLLNNPLLDGTAPEILVDNSDAGTEITGRWRVQKGNNSYVKDFLLSEAGPESASVTFRPLLYVKGKYKIYCYSPNLDPFRNEPLAEQIVCQVKHQGGVTEKIIPFEKTMEDWYLIGEFLCEPGDIYIVLKKSTGVVAVDAVILQPQF